MIEDNKGQVSLEYILIFSVSLILLVVFTLPITQNSVENTLDVSDTLDVKSDLSEIAHAVAGVYGQGQGSRERLEISSPRDIKLTVTAGYVSCSLKLKDSSTKQVKVSYTSTLEKSNLYLSKGDNSVIVEWPQDSENMRIYRV